jgi:hypothetical protein
MLRYRSLYDSFWCTFSNDAPVIDILSYPHIHLKWTELHLRPFHGVVVTLPVIPVNAVRRGISMRAVLVVQSVQVGVGTDSVPPGALLLFETPRSTRVVVVLVLGRELSTGIIFQTVT